MSFGEKLQKLRKAQGLSQEEIARLFARNLRGEITLQEKG